MNKVIRAALSIAGSALLLSAVATAQSADSSKDKANAGQEHHSKLAKAAFWKHKKNSAGSTKQAKSSSAATQSTERKTTAGKTQTSNPAEITTQKHSKHTASTKAVPVKRTTVTKTSATAKAKPKQNKAKVQTVSVKQ